MKIKLDLSNYATEAYLINATIGKVDELDVDKLVPVFVDLSILTDEVKTAIKKDVYNAKIYLMLLILLIMLK